MVLRIPVAFLGLDAFNPLEIPECNLTLLFGRDTARKWGRIVERSPNSVNKRMILARLLYVEKRYEEAIEQYRICLELLASPRIRKKYTHADNFEAHIHYHLGEVFLALGRRQEARAEWEKVLTLDTKFAKSARELLKGYPADGTMPKHQYMLIIVQSQKEIYTEEFADYEAAWPVYEDWTKAVGENHVPGVGLVDYYPGTGTGIWMKLTKNKEERPIIQKVISRRAMEWSEALSG
jgi:tetratricopeptide (TPR) repeat protein